MVTKHLRGPKCWQTWCGKSDVGLEFSEDCDCSECWNAAIKAFGRWANEAFSIVAEAFRQFGEAIRSRPDLFPLLRSEALSDDEPKAVIVMEDKQNASNQ